MNKTKKLVSLTQKLGEPDHQTVVSETPTLAPGHILLDHRRHALSHEPPRLATNHHTLATNHRLNHSCEQGVLDPVRGDDHRTIKGHRATPFLSLSNLDASAKGAITTAPTTNRRA
ncbi:hypothetical protein ACSQ67_011513 [Phaseolus vulgaris]